MSEMERPNWSVNENIAALKRNGRRVVHLKQKARELDKDYTDALAAQDNERILERVAAMWETQQWREAGYESWDEMVEAEAIPTEMLLREDAVRLSELGMSTRAIAAVTGVSHVTVASDVKATVKDLTVERRVIGHDGRIRTYTRPAPEPDVLTEEQWRAEVYEPELLDDLNQPEPEPRPHVVNNSGQNEWYTPAEYIEAARFVLGYILLDPASSDVAQRTVQAHTYFTAADDALAKEWPRGPIWMNPPYSQPLIGHFVDRVCEHDGEAIVLVNNGTETAWGQKLLAHATAVCFPRGRIRFIDPAGNPSGAPLQGQMIAYLGGNPARFHQTFRSFGTVLIGG